MTSAAKAPKKTGQRPKKATLEFVGHYNPAKGDHGYITAQEWLEVAEFVRETVQPLCWMSANSLRPFLTAIVRLAAWALGKGLPLHRDYLLSPGLLETFEVSQEFKVRSASSYLERLSIENGVTGARRHTGVARATYQMPYSEDEIDALLLFAKSHSNELRRATLLAIISLGAGAGVSREYLRGVSAECVHRHDDGNTFVSTTETCALVRPAFVKVMREVCELRPSGQLLGNVTGLNLTTAAAKWVADRSGVPTLHVDRLRASYVCALIDEGHGLADLMAWTGVRATESLNGYLPYTRTTQRHCQQPAFPVS